MTPEDVLAVAPPQVSVEHASAVLKALYGIVGEARPLPGDRDRNFAVHNGDGSWMLKIAHPAERPEVLEVQQQVLTHLQTWDSGLPVPQAIPTTAGQLVGSTEVDGNTLPVRLTSFIPGITVDDIGWSSELRRASAKMVARIGLALRSFTCPTSGAPVLWQIDHLADLRPYLVHLETDRKRFAEHWLDLYESKLLPALDGLRRQAIHGDFNPANLIVDPAQPDQLAGIIDFGDMTTGPLVADIAIAAAYQCLGADNPGVVIAEAAASYHRTCPLTIAEAEILPALAISRLVQSLLISGWRAAIQPDNSEYILTHAAPVWEALQRLYEVGTDRLETQVRELCGFDAVAPSTTDEALAKRRLRLGSGMRLSYDIPLHVTAGSGVWLTDHDGVRHLDAYNNVAHVGHSHPEVIAALTSQASRINTNTRYVVDEVTAYADRLAAMLPEPLEVVLFGNSGSEANDLAWRIARTVTGNRGMVVTDHAYHGSTYLTMATSPEELGIANLESWVATIAAPTNPDADPADVERAMERLAATGEAIAGYACDTVFSSDGIYEAPAGYLSELYAKVRKAGGLCIADEVQAGFGRVGSRLWGFAGSDVVPDIVTLGKPMGNGHPIAAVVTTTEIAEKFFGSGYYFSTFAGNPVSAAVANAVLDVMERHQLAAHADRVGAYLRAGLTRIATDYPVISGVRGPGMFIGLELSYQDGTPATEYASYVQNQMRNKQLLIGRTGAAGNVLKIRPPLVFAERHADVLLGKLRSQLDLDFSHGIMG